MSPGPGRTFGRLPGRNNQDVSSDAQRVIAGLPGVRPILLGQRVNPHLTQRVDAAEIPQPFFDLLLYAGCQRRRRADTS